ncbi:bifunctional folylpolyglutamate synthase/dihydrofolate synthase [Vicingus serpentipes]|uniref:Dihydrofolate synthase/folylpolyglutamate synthase n=1 Tax=Vicingus serpentipes TaxID=1926625 RepID=A0A5C6RPY0_9FLAO|nr:folylpolyglutamate synthase/dihydrofolate synthase family protein [Vicingus serpentipes]TXB64025.1 bifunctional folylpolyglutamate synthase/dihydrofolate synthase [Vicingus serpentipes]
MTYQETLDYLFSQLPMYQRIGNAAYKVDLDNTIKLCALLGNPQDQFKSVHIAGTNGKGSTSHMLASVMQEADYKVGLYTSPHLKDFRERIKINGEMISEEDVVLFVEEYKSRFEKINLSFFEWTVGLAFYYFAKNKVDIAIIETGLGGRLDSTNVVKPEVSVITNIGIDHTQFLGDTLPKIAFEKAGIIKNNIPVVIGETQDEVKNVFVDTAKEKVTPIYFADNEIKNSIATSLKGEYQKKNVKTVLATLAELKKIGWKIAIENIERGLENVVKNTGLLGRWQTISHSPLIICDTGHNEAGVKEIVLQLNKTTYNNLHFVFGVVNDKSVDNILDLLPKSATYYLCQAKIPRALAIDELEILFKAKKLKYVKCESVINALNVAKKEALENDLIFVGGSTFVVAEVV